QMCIRPRVAISPEYRTKAADENAEATIELNLFDVTRLHTKLTGSLLEWAIAGSTISRKQMDDMLAKINDARGLLAVYIKSITDESEIKEATHLQREFSTLRDKVEQLKIKQESLKVDTDDKVDRQPTDSAGRADDGHDSAADKPLPGSQRDKNVALPYLPVGGVFLAIALFIIALVKCSGSDATEAEADAGVDVVQNSRTHNGESEWKARRENSHERNKLLAEDNPNKSEYDEADNLAATHGEVDDFTTQFREINEKVQEAAQARNEPTAQSDRVNPGQSQVWTVTCDKETKRAEGTVKDFGFDAFTNEEPITLTSNYKLSFESVAGVSVDTSDHKSFSLKSTTPVKFTMKYKRDGKRDGDVLGTVTITFNDR
ncbi:MAG: hypothetical protein K2L33_01730, partial [Muribaculaceae bacterium]|nr:hypothetical protein [Muribaculaceae bacterium]